MVATLDQLDIPARIHEGRRKDEGGASATFVDGNHVDVCSVEGIIPVILGWGGGVGMMNH